MHSRSYHYFSKIPTQIPQARTWDSAWDKLREKWHDDSGWLRKNLSTYDTSATTNFWNHRLNLNFGPIKRQLRSDVNRDVALPVGLSIGLGLPFLLAAIFLFYAIYKKVC